MTSFYIPPDIEFALNQLGVRCGPASFAAITGLPVCNVLRYFTGFPHKQYTNLSSMRSALGHSGMTWVDRTDKAFPHLGLAWLEPTGPWEGQKLGFFKALKHSHWVGIYKDHVFDINKCVWFDVETWERTTAKTWVANCPNATGWKIRSSLEILSQP